MEQNDEMTQFIQVTDNIGLVIKTKKQSTWEEFEGINKLVGKIGKAIEHNTNVFGKEIKTTRKYNKTKYSEGEKKIMLEKWNELDLEGRQKWAEDLGFSYKVLYHKILYFKTKNPELKTIKLSKGNWTNEKKNKLIKMWNEGNYNYKKIGEELNLPRKIVYDMIVSLKKTGKL